MACTCVRSWSIDTSGSRVASSDVGMAFINIIAISVNEFETRKTFAFKRTISIGAKRVQGTSISLAFIDINTYR